MANKPMKTVAIPPHLPKHLAICYFGWDWITSALPDEDYGDLDRVMRETKERGFNCIRPDLGVGLMYDSAGKRRDRIEFGPWISGASENLQCVNCRGGGAHDLYERVMRLLELAEKYDLYVIGTTWLYQDFVCHVADERLRQEILTVPYADRLMFLAKQWDLLLRDCEERGLAHRIAMVELLNELSGTPVAVPADRAIPKPSVEDWLHQRWPRADWPATRGKSDEMLVFLQQKHPRLLFTIDFGAVDHMTELLPESAQVADFHVYSEGLTQAVASACGLALFDASLVPNPAGNKILRSLLKDGPIPWEDFKRRASRVRDGWHPIAWLYANVDNARYDVWCVEHFAENRTGIERTTEEPFRKAVDFASVRGLPMVVDEGYLCYPPLGSRLVMLPEGRYSEEFAVNIAIQRGVWGILTTGYFRPNTPLAWHDDSQCDWIAGLNRRILCDADTSVSP
jgi:hypothetical protein